MKKKPLLFMDVDGPLNPFRAKRNRRPDGYATFYLSDDYSPLSNDDVKRRRLRKSSLIRVWYSTDHADMFKSLSDFYDLRWGTKWNDYANTVLAPMIGVDPLPVTHVDNNMEPYCVDTKYARHSKDCDCLHTKTMTLSKFAGDRPFVWVDDESTYRDQRWLDMNHPTPSLAYNVDASVGLTWDDVGVLNDWANVSGH